MHISALVYIIVIVLLMGSVLYLILSNGTLRQRHREMGRQMNNYHSIIDQANDTMLVIDIVDGRIHQSNPSAARLLGYTEEELATKTLFNLHPPEYLERSSSIVADVWEKGGMIYKDIPFIKKSGELIPVECSAKVAPFAGRPAIVIYARDISERLRLEEEINAQRAEIDEKNKDIADSIEYSRRIQRSILVEKEKLKEYAPESFIFFKPREVVSGDFYWFTRFEVRESSASGNMYQKGNRILAVAAADCTGHGVPGAFMSLIGNAMLNAALSGNDKWSAASALDRVDAGLKENLNRNSEEKPLRDGMDIAFCCIDMERRKLEFAGANNPAYVVRGNELFVINADKQPITASRESEARPFTNQYFDLEKGDCVYLFTDGYADQFGGEKEKKFMYKRLKELLIAIHNEGMSEQKRKLYETFQNWKGSLSQVDDVLVIGIRIH